MPVLVVGSIALDDVKTPLEERQNLLGGSATYGCVAASFYGPVNLVGIVGEDFPKERIDLFKQRNVDLAGLEVIAGKTCRWSGEYMWDLNICKTRSIALNVFEHFTPVLPEAYKGTPVVLLGNIAPDLQHHVFDQVRLPRFVIADTMDLWIDIAKPRLLELLTRIHMLILNDGEARQLTGETSLIKAARRLRDLGPRFIVIKKGEHGCLLFGEEDQFFSCPAYPLDDIHDPTGAGDAFAGGLAGYPAKESDEVNFAGLRRAVVHGSVLASYNVEAFSLERLRTVTWAQISERFDTFRRLSQFDAS